MTDNQGDHGGLDLSREEEEALEERRRQSAATAWAETDARLYGVLGLVFGPNFDNVDNSLTLTVLTDGAVITGSVISEASWAQQQADTMQQQSEYMSSGLRELQKSEVERHADRKENILHDMPPRYIHFGTAAALLGGSQLDFSGARVALRSVSAWYLGSKVFK